MSTIIFYDIDNKTNTLKTKLALNLKGIPYQLEWVSYPDIAGLLKSKGVTPAGGPPRNQFTLPAIEHNGKTIMDSAAIAQYLDDTFPDTPRLYPEHCAPLSRLVQYLAKAHLATEVFPLLRPKIVDFLDPRGGEYFKRTREEETGPISHDIYKDQAKVNEFLKAAAPSAKALATALQDNPEGPYFLGKTRSYADIELVSVLEWFKVVNKDLYDHVVSEQPTLKVLHDAFADLL